jgi:hypothetical protein
MKRRKALWVVGLLALVAGVILVWPSKSFRLVIARRGVQRGMPVVYFRVEGGPHRRILFTRMLTVQEQQGLDWATVMGSSGEIGRQEFGVLAPVNDSPWRLRVSVIVDVSTIQRLKTLPRIWKTARRAKFSFLKAARYSRDVFSANRFEDDGRGPTVIESDIITNAIPEPAKLVDSVKP